MVEIQLDGGTCILQPGFERLSKVEQATGLGLVMLARKLGEGEITLEELATIIAECSVENRMTIDMVKQSLIGSGLAQALEAVTLMFVMVFEGTGNDPHQELNKLMALFPDATEARIP